MARFRSKLTARVLPVVFVGFAVSTAVAVASSASAQQAAVADKGRDITSTAAAVVDGQTRSAQQAAIVLAGAASGFTGSDRNILVGQVRSVARVTEGVSDAYLVYEKNRAPGPDSRWRRRPGMTDTGRFFTVYLRNASGAPTLAYYDEKAVETAVADEWFVGPKTTGRLTTSEPYVDPGTHVLMTSFTYPITNAAGRFLGAAGVDLPLGDLSRRIGETKVGRTGYAMLVSGQGVLIAAPTGKVSAEGVIGFKSLAQAVASDRRVAVARIVRRSRVTTDGHLTGQDPFGSGSALITWTRVPSTGWTLITVLPTAEIRGPVIALEVKLILTAIVVLGTVAAALLLAAARLTRSMPLVRDAALQIADGRLDVAIPPGEDDELGEVSSAFAAIVASLRGANDTHNRFAQVQALADADSLTGIPNRRRFFELAEGCVAGSHAVAGPDEPILPPRDPISVLMIDIDHFKPINDSYGHPTGDDVIIAVSGRLADCLRGGDIIGRYGGEEFAVVLPGADPHASIAERLRSAVADQPMPTRSGPLSVTISVGMAAVLPGESAISEALARADQALYRAKQAGRNQVVQST